jgi:acyl-coenzyme A thioesterase PaaI-like protein
VSDELPNPWQEEEREWVNRDPGPRGGAEFERVHLGQRTLQSLLAGAALPAEVGKDVADRLDELAAILAQHQVAERDRNDGWRTDLPGRGMPVLPPYFIDTETDVKVTGRVTFPRFYLGGNGAAHGGSHSLLFDDVLGRVMNHHRPGVARTARLTVNYRRITPIDTELTFDATVDGIDGRKRFGSARLYNPDGVLVSDAEALFLELLPGQQ